MAVEIPLTKGFVAIVDDEDADLASRRWHTIIPKRIPYAASGWRPTILLHREIAARMGLEIDGLMIDHINGDGIDNRRSNLRAVTTSENNRNVVGAQRNSTSGLRGVSFMRDRSKWRAQIKAGGRYINLWDFASKEDANKARLKAERELWGIQPRRAEAHR